MTNEPGKIIAEIHQSQELQASSFILDFISEQENPHSFLAISSRQKPRSLGNR